MPDHTETLLSLPPPRLARQDLARLALDGYGLSGELIALTSERDQNHRLVTTSGQSYVLRLSNPAEPVGMTAFQTEALRHVAARAPDLPVPRIIPARDGRTILPTPQGALRLFSWLEGAVLSTLPTSPAQSASLGTALARLTAALADFDHPAADHVLLWDIRQAPALLPLLPHVADTGLRATATTFLDDFTTRIAPALARLPSQVVHADFNPHNLLVDPADPAHLTGILDFGDMVRTPRICDLAVAASYRIDPAAPLDSLSPMVAAYHQTLPLTAPEIALLFDLITARMVTTIAIPSWRAARYPENAAYILRNFASAKAGLGAFRALDPARATATFARACGME